MKADQMKFSCGYVSPTIELNIQGERNASWRSEWESTAMVPMTSQFCPLSSTSETADDSAFYEATSGEFSTNTPECTSFPRAVPDKAVTAWSYAQEQRLYHESWYPYYDGSTAARPDNFCFVGGLNKSSERLLDGNQSMVNVYQANSHSDYRLPSAWHHFEEAQSNTLALYHHWTAPEVALSQSGPSQPRLMGP